MARAVINDPAVILADEPTAALDTERGKAVMDLLRHLGRTQHAAVIVVTHDERMIEGFDRVYHMIGWPDYQSLIAERRRKFMPDWLGFIAFFAVYIVLMRWVLPSSGRAHLNVEFV